MEYTKEPQNRFKFYFKMSVFRNKLMIKSFQYLLKNRGYTAYKTSSNRAHHQQKMETTGLGRGWMRKTVLGCPLEVITKTGPIY